MSNFSYTVSQKDNKGLTEIFLQKAKAEGFKEKDIDWNAVMSVFDKIQTEEKVQGQSLFSGGINKTPAGWHNSYVIKKGDKIELDENQMAEIYKAMGFTNPPATSAVTEPAATAPIASKPVEAPADSVKTQAEDFALPSGIADTTKTPTAPVTTDTIKAAPTAEVKTTPTPAAKDTTPPAPVTKDSAPAPAVVITPKTVKAPEIVPAAKPETIPTAPAATDTTKAQPLAEVKITPTPATKDTTPPASVVTDTTKAAPVAEIKDAKKAEAPKDSSKTSTEEAPDAKKYNTIDMENIKGDYKISAGKDGKGFTLLSDVSVQGTPKEEQKFFRPVTYNEETKQYSVRDLKSTDQQMIMDMAHSEAKELAANQAIYTDLNTKASSGTNLSEPEKAFMTSHKESLKTKGLQLNDKNEITEIPKPIPLKKPVIEQKEAEPDTSLWERITNW